MKAVKSMFIIFLLLIKGSAIFCQEDKIDILKYTGPYLGQTQPDDKPILFLTEIFTNVHSSPAFSPDLRQVYWRSMDQKPLLFMEEVNGEWTAPESVPFSSLFYKQDVPFFSNDGMKLFFITTKPQHWYQLWSDEAIWYVEKEEDGWSDPKQVSEEINRIYTHWQFSVSKNGNIYFNGKNEERWFIYKSDYKNGEYSKPVKIDSPQYLAKGQPDQYFPFTSPDESYLIFSKSTNNDQGDLFICYRKTDGSLTEEINLGGRINSKGIEICPVISPDGKFLFFIRNGKIMWVSAKFIDNLKPVN